MKKLFFVAVFVFTLNTLVMAQKREGLTDSLNMEISTILKNDYLIYKLNGEIWNPHTSEVNPVFDGYMITLFDDVVMPVYGNYSILVRNNEPPGHFISCLYIDSKYMLYKKLKKIKSQYVLESKSELERLAKLLKLKADNLFNKDLENFKIVAEKYSDENKQSALKEEYRKLSIQANVLAEETKYSEALKLYESSLKSDPLAFPGAYYNMANIAASGKYFGYAILNLKKFLLLKPSEEEARKAQDLIYLWEIKGR